MNSLSDRSITLLHYSCPPVIGGAEFIVEAQARWFNRYGADVEVLVGEGEQFHEDIAVQTMDCLSSDWDDDDRIRSELRAGNRDAFNRAVEEARDVLGDYLSGTNTWFIHNVLTMPFNLVATVALRQLIQETSTQAFAWTHDVAWFDDKYELEDEFPWNLLREPAAVTSYVAISGHRREQLEQLFGGECDIEVIHDAVEFDEFHELDEVVNEIYRRNEMYRDDIIALYPARVVRRKNFELALRIVRGLKDLGNRIHFIITGPPDPHNQDSMEYFQELINLRETLGLEEDVIFCYELEDPVTGDRLEMSFDRVRQLYRISDILLMTSRQEGFGLPILEAGLTRTVICCSDINPLPEVGGEAPVYFDLDDSPDAIAGQIDEYLDTQAAVNLQRRVRKGFTWPAVFEQKIIPLLNDRYPLSQAS